MNMITPTRIWVRGNGECISGRPQGGAFGVILWVEAAPVQYYPLMPLLPSTLCLSTLYNFVRTAIETVNGTIMCDQRVAIVSCKHAIPGSME